MSNRDDGGASSPGHAETLFATPEWFAIWSAAFGQDNYNVWRPAGAARDLAIPYCRQHVKITGLSLPIARSAANYYSPRYDVIGGEHDSIDPNELLRELDVSCADFYGVSEHSRLLKGIERRIEPNQIQRDLFEIAPFVDCTKPWDSYWAGRGKNLRSNLLSIEKKLRGSRVEVLRLAEWDEIEHLRETIYEVEASGWKGRQGTAIVQSAKVRSFYDQLLFEFGRRDLLRLFVLRIDGDVVAFELNTLYRGVLSALKGGFRETFAKVSPGQFLRHAFLQWAFAEPQVTFYDMLGPASETKTRWATGSETLFTVRVFRRSLTGLLFRARFVAGPRVKAYLARRRRGVPIPPGALV
jgi:hypothetical protein